MKVVGFVAKVALIVFLTGFVLGLVVGLRAAESLTGLGAAPVVVGGV